MLPGGRSRDYETQEKRISRGHEETFGSHGYGDYLEWVIGSWMYKHIKICQIPCFKHVQIIVCQFYLSKVV
jgi:hypothetical protein